MQDKRVLHTVIAALIFFSISSASAQIGIKAGPGISDIVFKQDCQTPYLGYEINSLDHRKPLLTFQAGIFSSINISERIEVQPELLLIGQGLNYSTEYLYDDITYKINIHYLHVPLTIRYKLSLKDSRNSGLFAGIYSSLKLKATLSTKLDGEENKSRTGNVNNTDFGLVCGYSSIFIKATGDIVLFTEVTVILPADIFHY